MMLRRSGHLLHHGVDLLHKLSEIERSGLAEVLLKRRNRARVAKHRLELERGRLSEGEERVLLRRKRTLLRRARRWLPEGHKGGGVVLCRVLEFFDEIVAAPQAGKIAARSNLSSALMAPEPSPVRGVWLR